MNKRIYKITFLTQEGESHKVEIVAEDILKATELLARTHPAVYPTSLVCKPHMERANGL